MFLRKWWSICEKWMSINQVHWEWFSVKCVVWFVYWKIYQSILYFCYSILSNCSFQHFFYSFLTIHLCLNYLSHLNISYKILIMLILNSLSDNCNISVISESRSDDCFVFSDWELFCLLFCLVVFWWNPGLIYWVTGTEVKRTLVWGFILTWLRVGLCLMFVPEASNSSNVLMP